MNTQYAHNLKLLERDGAEYYESKNQFVWAGQALSGDWTKITMELMSRKVVYLIAFLAAFLSSVAGKTEAGKNCETGITLLLL